MTQVVGQDLAFANDGTIVNPITLEADFDDLWGDEVDLSATALATLTFGSKAIVFAADISGVLAAHDWIYANGDDTRVFAYEVADVSMANVTLYLPYKGGQAGAGKTMLNMQAAPIWNTAAGDFQVNLDADNYWKFQGIHFRGTDLNGVFEIDTAGPTLFKDCIWEANNSGDYCIYNTDDRGYIIVDKCRFYNYKWGVAGKSGFGAPWAHIKNSLFDGNSIAASIGLYANTWSVYMCEECEFKNHVTGDIAFTTSTSPALGAYIELRNCILSSVTEVDSHHLAVGRYVGIEDYEGTVGDNSQLIGLSTAEGTPILQSETTEVRAGGGATSIKVTPSANIDTDWEFSRILLFEYPIYAVKDVAKTYTAYLRSDDDTDWDADPLNTELWIEAEYWGHATNVHRKILKSTEVCNNFDADDTDWDTLTVTVTPLQTGVLYLRGYYCKTKEAGNSNIFFCDTVIGVA